ncbi:MAG: hypothetical protein A3J75_08625 [Acidobacteria bacterium RBG_16_68_9]|nr:MAG: hypothetical protein A3J75_08625 [Acidobacteria bacterium RBG_16_68_9]
MPSGLERGGSRAHRSVGALALTMRWLRRPLVHFLASGAVMFAAQQWLLSSGPSQPPPIRRAIVITAAQVEELREEFTQRTGLVPTADDEAALIDTAIQEELLYREALARGLDRNDRSVQYRLIEKMRAVSSVPNLDPATLYRQALELGLDRDDAILRRMLVEKMRLLSSAAEVVASESELQQFFDARREGYRQPVRVSLRHVFFSAQQDRVAAERRAVELLDVLQRQHVAAEVAVGRGDPFPLGHRFAASSAQDLARSFGPDFGRMATSLPPGTWTGPITSPYGLHLVWVDTIEPARLPPLDAVRGQVLEAYRTEQRQMRFQEFLRHLRAQYEIRVEVEAYARRGSA